MPLPLAIPLALSAASFFGGMLGNRKKEQTSKFSNTTSTSLSPGGNVLNDQLLKMITSRLSAPSALPSGYQEGGIKDINSVFDVINQSKNANLTARGLSDSPVAAIGTDDARGGQIANFTSGLPLVERGLRNEDMNFAQSLFAMQPRTTTQSGTGTQTQPGNMLGGGFSDLASMIGYLMGTGAFGQGKKV
jgi:hypothetical protein